MAGITVSWPLLKSVRVNCAGMLAKLIPLDLFTNGIGFDGSSLRGWQPIHESDMFLIPDATTLKMDPFSKHATAAVICDVVIPEGFEPYHKDPRAVAKKALDHLRSTNVASDCRIGPEAEY